MMNLYSMPGSFAICLVPEGGAGYACAMLNGDWYKDESFWIGFAPVMFDERRWAEVPGVCDLVESIAGHPDPGSTPVLDALCGPGRIAVEMASRGYPVTGVDLSPSYLEAARSSADGLDCEFVLSDVRAYDGLGRFALVLNLYNSFGYLESPAEDLRMLAALRRSLRPGGIAVMELLGKELAARDFKRGEEWERDGRSVSTRCEVLGAWEGVRNAWRVEEGGRVREGGFDQRLYSGTELAAALSSAGFAEIGIYGALDLRPYDQGADNLVAVCRA